MPTLVGKDKEVVGLGRNLEISQMHLFQHFLIENVGKRKAAQAEVVGRTYACRGVVIHGGAVDVVDTGTRLAHTQIGIGIVVVEGGNVGVQLVARLAPAVQEFPRHVLFGVEHGIVVAIDERQAVDRAERIGERTAENPLLPTVFEVDAARVGRRNDARLHKLYLVFVEGVVLIGAASPCGRGVAILVVENREAGFVVEAGKGIRIDGTQRLTLDERRAREHVLPRVACLVIGVYQLVLVIGVHEADNKTHVFGLHGGEFHGQFHTAVVDITAVDFPQRVAVDSRDGLVDNHVGTHLFVDIDGGGDAVEQERHVEADVVLGGLFPAQVLVGPVGHRRCGHAGVGIDGTNLHDQVGRRAFVDVPLDTVREAQRQVGEPIFIGFHERLVGDGILAGYRPYREESVFGILAELVAAVHTHVGIEGVGVAVGVDARKNPRHGIGLVVGNHRSEIPTGKFSNKCIGICRRYDLPALGHPTIICARKTVGDDTAYLGSGQCTHQVAAEILGIVERVADIEGRLAGFGF